MKIRQLGVLCIVVRLAVLLPGAALPAPAAQSGFSCADVTEIPQSECEALVALYNSTNGPGWAKSDRWLAGRTLRHTVRLATRSVL